MKKIITIFLYLFTLIISLCYTINYTLEMNFRALAFIPLLFVLALPAIVKKTLKIKLSYDLEITYIIFIFLTQVGGSIINLYDVWHSYDTFLHCLSGVASVILGLIILKFSKIDFNKNKTFTVIYLFSFKFLIAGLWEIYEYTYDNLTGSDMQTSIVTGALDTMIDNIAALTGGIIIIILFLIPKTNKIINNILNKKHITKR